MKLLLLTQTYPFGRGESFVESELELLRMDWSVTVVPAYGIEGVARSLPGGVELDLSLARGSLVAEAIRFLAGSAARAASVSELRRHGSRLLHPRRAAYAVYYLLRGGRAARWLRRRLDAEPASVLCYWSNAEAFGAALATRSRREIRFACRAHRGDLYENLAPAGYLPFRDEIVERAQVVLAVSDDGARHLARRHPEHADKVVTSRLSLRDGPYPMTERTDDAIVVASCSTDAPVKRLPMLASTVARLAALRADRRILWLHAGLDTARIASMTPGRTPANLSIEGTGWLAPDRVRETWRSRRPDVFVNLSSSEGVPVSIMEALSMGVPTVATAAGGTAELVDEGVGALLPVDLEVGDAARALSDVVDRSRRLSESARARYLERCGQETVGARFRELLRDHLRDQGEAS